MDTHKINYCCSSGFLVKNDRIKHDIISKITDSLGFNPLNLYEKSYSDRLVNLLKSKDLLGTYISLGKYVFLYLTRLYNENIALIIETNCSSDNIYPKIISVPCSFKDHLFDGTLIYGEIFRTKQKTWHFLAEKLYLYENRSIKANVINNIKIINDIIDKGYSFSSINPFTIQVKKYFKLNDIEGSIEELSRNNISLKGIKFYGLKTAINFYFNTHHYNKDKYNMRDLPEINTDIEDSKKELIEMIENEQEYKECLINIPEDYKAEYLYLEMRKCDSYGIYELYARVENSYKLEFVGKARIEMIEMSQNIINDTRKRFIVMCKYNYIFKKFDILHIVDNNVISEKSDAMNEINKTSGFPVPNYAE